MKYKILYEYIPYFENVSSVVVQFMHGIGGNRYDAKFLEFIKDVYRTDLLQYSALYKHEMSYIKPEDIFKCDIETIKALIVHYVRAERFCDGMWQSATRKGYFKVLLKKLYEFENMSEEI